MWTWSLNWGEITPRIVIGTCPMTPADVRRVHTEASVSAVLSVQHDDCLTYWNIDYAQNRRAGEELGLRMARSPMRDFDIPDQRRRLPRAVAELARLQAEPHRTYVHCTAGLGRAPLTVLTYLILVERQDPEVAIQSILRGRPDAVPAWEAYHGCREDLVARYRQAIEVRAYVLSQEEVNNNADRDWSQAESEVLRQMLLAPP